MTKSKIPNWAEWKEEKNLFADRETEGYWKDYRALEIHIAKLREVAPKDVVGFLHLDALTYLNSLQEELARARLFSEPLKLTHWTSPD